jgi:hypothetical protein
LQGFCGRWANYASAAYMDTSIYVLDAVATGTGGAAGTGDGVGSGSVATPTGEAGGTGSQSSGGERRMAGVLVSCVQK